MVDGVFLNHNSPAKPAGLLCLNEMFQLARIAVSGRTAVAAGIIVPFAAACFPVITLFPGILHTRPLFFLVLLTLVFGIFHFYWFCLTKGNFHAIKNSG
jgi:hypothetical protein